MQRIASQRERASNGMLSYEGIVTERQFDNVGCDGHDVLEKLVENGWAQQLSPEEVRLTANLRQEKGQMSEIFGNNFSKILRILKQSDKQRAKIDRDLLRAADLLDVAEAFKVLASWFEKNFGCLSYPRIYSGEMLETNQVSNTLSSPRNSVELHFWHFPL